eukprot:CAMPEP_0194293728 /NCGR_PEP_ID=MMETSP0169-20130528/48506_1 /TAXON_ID=218684 /ORGANISM="Corethron pennatum, Strain L29A3" /LENGTH=436 /DNA_ID=CAMNT_0039042339 /DNA_START=108 /DNA_END=1418 /DNA_ORIENTATION=-
MTSAVTGLADEFQKTSISISESLRSSPENEKFPSVYEEADEMLHASILMYTIAAVREVAKDGDKFVGDPSLILDTPISIGTALRAVGENAEELKKYGEDCDQVLEVLRSMEKRSASSSSDDWLSAMMGAGQAEASLEYFCDDNANSELVYAIGIDRTRRRVTVAFRGSVTQTDWLTDLNMFGKSVPNPLYDEGGKQSKDLLIHNGFHEYLFYPSKVNKIAKFEEIISQAGEILMKNPGYRLYVTGHSLGGALSSLFAFEAAASSATNIPKPVTCVSIASPKVGAAAFGNAFRLLEKQGKLRYLRVANDRDAVTLAPDLESLSGAYSLVCQDRVYRHVGIELKLFAGDDGDGKQEEPRHRICYSGKQRGNLLLHVMKKQATAIAGIAFLFRASEFGTNHGCGEYGKRLGGNKEELLALNLDDLYKDPEVCGGIFDGL